MDKKTQIKNTFKIVSLLLVMSLEFLTAFSSAAEVTVNHANSDMLGPSLQIKNVTFQKTVQALQAEISHPSSHKIEDNTFELKYRIENNPKILTSSNRSEVLFKIFIFSVLYVNIGTVIFMFYSLIARAAAEACYKYIPVILSVVAVGAIFVMLSLGIDVIGHYVFKEKRLAEGSRLKALIVNKIGSGLTAFLNKLENIFDYAKNISGEKLAAEAGTMALIINPDEEEPPSPAEKEADNKIRLLKQKTGPDISNTIDISGTRGFPLNPIPLNSFVILPIQQSI
ncbi:MAG: hypothetical protein L6416_02490 [Candidatus Omnitrophica bacterium]|nr:hypothetical protein [Candidatus Omnitrophota bacterium]